VQALNLMKKKILSSKNERVLK